MGCWEIAILALVVVVLFPKPFLRYASRWMTTTPWVSPAAVPTPDSGDWVEVKIAEERRLVRQDVPIWLGGWSASFAGAVLAWLAASRGSPSPAARAALGLGLGLALLGAGLGIERLSGWLARCFQAAGISLLLLTLAVAVCRDGSLSPLPGLLFLAIVVGTTVALLGNRPGAVALAIGLLTGGAFTAPLDWERASGGLLLPFLLIFLLPLGWRRGWLAPLLLAASGSTVGVVLCGPGEGGLVTWISRGALVAGALLLGRMEPYVQGLAWAGSGFALALIAAGTLSPLARLGLGLTLAAATWLSSWGAVRPARWAALAALSGLTMFLLLAFYVGVDLDWSGPALAMSFLYLGAAWLMARGGKGDEASSLTVAPFAVAAAAFAALAVALAIGRGWPGIAAALLTPLLVALAVRLRLPDLGGLAILSAIFCLGWMLLHWEDLGFLGSSPDTPWLLYDLGVPFLAIVAAVWIAHRGDAPRFAARMTKVVVLAGMLLALMAVRQLVPSATTFWLMAAFLAPLLAFLFYRRLSRRAAS